MLIQYYLYEVNMEKDLYTGLLGIKKAFFRLREKYMYTGLLGIMKAFFRLKEKYMDKNKGKKLKVAVWMNILLNSIR